MLPYVLRRIGLALGVAWLALSLAFVALRGLPGDAVDATLTRAGWGADEVAARRAALHLDDPLSEQYLRYLAQALRGDWGESLISGQAVTDVIRLNLGPTAALALAALIVAVALGVILGVINGAAPWPGVRLAAGALAGLALATPVYWTATLALYLFSTALDLLPGAGERGLRALVLPALVLGFHAGGSIAQVTARSVRAVLCEDFVRTARAKGLPEIEVLDHALRVALLPVIAVIALQLSFLIGGTVITETIFARRGLGRVLLEAIADRDYPVVQGLVVLAALVISAIQALADVMMGFADPRVPSAVSWEES